MRSLAFWLFVAFFIVLNVAVDRYIDLAPGPYSGIAGMRLNEIFLVWAPILFLAAFLGFGIRRPFPLAARFGALFAYAALLCVFALFNNPRGADLFYFLLRFAPIPALVFLFGDGTHRWSLSRCFGFTLMFFSLWRGVYFSIPDLIVIAGGGAVSASQPAILFYRDFFLKLLWDVFYPLLGLLFFFQRVPWLHKEPTWGRELEALLRPFNAWIRRSGPYDLAWGGFVFAIVLVLDITAANLLAKSSAAGVGNDSQYFVEITLDQVFILSIMAGASEELLFRGLLQGGLERILRFQGTLRRAFAVLGIGGAASVLATVVVAGVSNQGLAALFTLGGYETLVLFLTITTMLAIAARMGGPGVAIILQALAFASVHAGYASLTHLLLPLLFGLLAGLVYRYFGLLAAILIHTEIDIFAFGATYATGGRVQHPWMLGFLGLLFFANVVYGLFYLLFRLVTWLGRTRRASAVLARA